MLADLRSVMHKEMLVSVPLATGLVVAVLVVEAVDALGHVPQQNLYSGAANTPLAPGGMLGSNKGQTADGKLSTNGQGPYTNNPKVIAVSQPFVVQPNVNLKAIPSNAAAT